MRCRLALAGSGAGLLALAPTPAFADNCGSLSDCWDTILAAVLVALLIALLIVVAVEVFPALIAEAGVLSAAEVAEAAEVAGFTAEEAGILAEARTILSAPELAQIAEAHASGESLVVNVGGRLIQYEPGLSSSGMTMFGENGFLIGNEAFATEGELSKTVLHELYRLATSESAGGLTAEMAASETQAAASFAERAYEFLKGLGALP